MLTALLVLGVIEAMAWLTHSLLYDEHPSPGSVAGSLSTADRKYRGLVAHPFYGVIDDDDFHELNIASARKARKECGLVVGLLGGSIASAAFREFELALLRRAVSLGSSVSPIVVNLAHHRYRQPRQAQAFVNKLAGSTGSRRFHIVVSLDGFNEVKEPLDVLHISGSGGSLFPKEWPFMIAMTAEQRLAAGRILALRDEQEALLAGGGMRGSATFGLLRRWRLDRIERLVVRQHHDLFEAGNVPHDLEKHGPRRTSAADELRRAAAESWYRGALLLDRLATRQGAEYYHFLQPNQYVPGAKPLTDRELRKAFWANSRAAKGVRSGYPLLAEYGRRLRERGVEFFDLSRIYADVYETLYTDPCCHLNRRGNELLAAAMLRRIIEATDADGAIHADWENESCLPYRAAVAGIEAGEFGEPAARSVFDVYRKERTLVYLKRHCTVDDITDWFFLHFTRSEGSFGGDQFPFLRHGLILDGDTCVAIVRLGNDGIVHMRTGQLRSGRDTWSVEPDVAGLETTT